MATRWWRDPILHFLLIGGLLFVVYAKVTPKDNGGERIVVTQAMAEELSRQHQARWMRPPNEQELASWSTPYATRSWYRGPGTGTGPRRPGDQARAPEARHRGRRQLGGAAPNDDELAAYMTRHAARYTRPASLTFEQIFFDGSATVPEVERAVAVARTALARGVDAQALGQPTLLPRSADQQPADRIERDFGAVFTESLNQLPVGVWSGPVASGLGAHLVRVSARTPAVLPPLDEVRQQVTRDWENERRDRSREQSYRKLRERYDVVIEPALTALAAQR
ncbi:MAG: peptidyl-prolyl cis-trans isomerase [Betaproteobacteria bacterium]|nr:peptidyl-prolyl cis-trans isomerase [Betaproteobacteria bacterium]